MTDPEHGTREKTAHNAPGGDGNLLRQVTARGTHGEMGPRHRSPVCFTAGG